MASGIRKRKPKAHDVGSFPGKKPEKNLRAPGLDMQAYRLSAQLGTERPGSAQAEMQVGKAMNASAQRLDIPPGTTANNYLGARG
jgi:hypothetical protein